MKKFKDCKKDIFEFKDKIIDDKTYNVKVYHFKACKNCKENCNGKINYKAQQKVLGIINKLF